jgi:hypothetical protein
MTTVSDQAALDEIARLESEIAALRARNAPTMVVHLIRNKLDRIEHLRVQLPQPEAA